MFGVARLPPLVITAVPTGCWPKLLHSSSTCAPLALAIALLRSPAEFIFMSVWMMFTMASVVSCVRSPSKTRKARDLRQQAVGSCTYGFLPTAFQQEPAEFPSKP